MKISFFLIDKAEEDIIINNFKEHSIKIFSEPLNLKNLVEVKDSDIIVSKAVFLNLEFDRNTLKNFPNLKMISTMSTGFDHIDLIYCKEKGIFVSNVPSYGEKSVAEFTFALILSLLKQIPKSINQINGRRVDSKEITGSDLNEKIIGVIGTGRIGLNVIKIAKAFGLKVQAYDIFENQKAIQELGFDYIPLNELLKNSDIISFHAPLNEQTYHILNKNNISLLKKDVAIINTARGGLIDTSALIDFLRNNPESLAGLDVFEGESNILSSNELKDLLELDNVLITPHNASNTKEAKQRMLDITIKNVLNFIKSKPLNLV
ncbi:MAG: NAD(P)-dependent oxidoreductase [Candidatus Nanoarchaeia archaeon]|nr:NAD(P)-dependent oxidoreductase [Candidatus Nanoarchaeia archaeon]